jgi:hypothetical protein
MNGENEAGAGDGLAWRRDWALAGGGVSWKTRKNNPCQNESARVHNNFPAGSQMEVDKADVELPAKIRVP